MTWSSPPHRVQHGRAAAFLWWLPSGLVSIFGCDFDSIGARVTRNAWDQTTKVRLQSYAHAAPRVLMDRRCPSMRGITRSFPTFAAVKLELLAESRPATGGNP